MKTYTAAASILLVGLTVAAAPAGQRQSGKGLSLIMTMTMNMPQLPKPQVMMMAQIRFSSGGKGRSDWLSTDSARAPAPPPPTGNVPPLLRAGTYSLGKKGNDTTLIVDPVQKKVWVMLKSDNAATATAAQNIAHDEYVNVEVSAQRVQPDTTVSGIAVQHWRVVDNHTQRTHVFGSTNSTIVKSNYEIYSAPEFDLGGFNPATAMGKLATDSVYGPKLRAAMVQAMPGFPLMMRTQMQILDNKGKTMSFSMAMLVSNVTRGDPPASIFVIPAGYTTVRAELPGASVRAMAAQQGGVNAGGITPSGVAAMPHGDTTHQSVLDTAAKQSGTNATTNATNDATNNAGQAVKQKLKSVIHFP